LEPRELGIGLVWWPAVDELCHVREGLVDVIEVEPESFWAPRSDGFGCIPRGLLDHLPQPKLLHGVGAPLGGTCPPPQGHTASFVEDVLALRPEYVSEHLSINHFRPSAGRDALFAGFLLPPLQSADGVAVAADNVRRRRTALGDIPLAIETPVSYLPNVPGEWPDGEFMAAVAEQADCGILLDLHNVWCNARNGRQAVAAYCDALPLERIWEIHVAGGEYLGSFYLDAHSGVAAGELLGFTASLVKRLPQLRAITFEVMPDRVVQSGLHPLAQQLKDLRDIWNTRGTECRRRSLVTHSPTSEGPALSPEAWESLLGAAVSELPEPALTPAMAEWRRKAAPALELYRKLVREARASALVLAAPRCMRLMLRTHGGGGTRRILAEFWRESPPGYTTSDEAKAFMRFLGRNHANLPGLVEAMALDWEQPVEM
jgi:uncharacterized protein (UPF0276 family)